MVTTNGCFDLLHPGHIRLLETARSLGELLVVGLNSDESVRQLKGAGRPLVSHSDRASMLLALSAVDYVVIFDELLPIMFLERIRPDIHCKGGDYVAEGLPEAETVHRHGGKICILPLTSEHSTSGLIRRILAIQTASIDCVSSRQRQIAKEGRVTAKLLQTSHLLRQAAYCLAADIVEVAEHISSTLRVDGRIIFCGSGESAYVAQHFAGEFVRRLERDRLSSPTIALTLTPPVVTDMSPDYNPEQVLAHQVEIIGQPVDFLVAISTRGISPDVLAAVKAASSLGIRTAGLTGADGGKLVGLSNHHLPVPSANAALIHQGQAAVLHLLCDLVEDRLKTIPVALSSH